MLVPLTITALLTRGGFIASPYWHHHDLEYTTVVHDAEQQDAADARLAPDDDTPSTAAQIPALRAALAFSATAQFDLAATALDTFATQYPNAAESAWALRRAYLYWHALGRDTEATRTLRHYETHHAHREPRAAAIFHWSRREHSTQRRDHANTYLARHAKHGPPDLRIAAEAELAADLWRASCPRTWQGLCVDYTWTTTVVACTLGRAPLFTVRPRDPALSREALRHATTVAHLARTLDLARVAPWRRPALRAALGQAALVTSDDAIETLIALEFPHHLFFNVEEYKNTPEIPKWQKEYREQVRRRDASLHKFRDYWTAYLARHNAADRSVNALRDTGSAPAFLLGMTRLSLAVGEVMDEQDFVPTDDMKPLRRSDNVYCHPGERTRPWLENANGFLKTCAELVRASGMHHPDLNICFEGFSRLYGAEDWLPEFHTPA